MQHARMLNSMRAATIVVVGLWPTTGASQWSIQIEPQDDLVRRVTKEIGERAGECGRLVAPGTWKRAAYSVADVWRPIECITKAATERRPAWFVLRGLTLDSWNATGLWVSEDGAIRYYSYDNYGGNASLEVLPCANPSAAVNADGFPYIACGPPQ